MDRTEREMKHSLLRCLCPGRETAITGRELARVLGYRDDRTIRQAIRELIAEGVPIASTTESPGGYFIASSQAEVKEYANDLRSRLVNDALRRRDFLRASRAVMQPRQLTLI